MPSVLDSLKKCSVVVADTGDIDAVAKWRPQDTTTNPSLLLSAALDTRFLPLIQKALLKGKLDAEAAFRWQHNEDAMAVEKLSEGIRKFDADARKLERAVAALLATPGAASVSSPAAA